MWKQKLALALVLVMLLTCVGPAFGSLPPVVDASAAEWHRLESIGKQSSDSMTRTIIDLAHITSGSVTTYTYEGDIEALTINNFTVNPQDALSAGYRITPFAFHLTNQYRPDTSIIVTSLRPDTTVHTATYGARKDEAMFSILTGLVDCLNNPPVHQDRGSGLWTSKYSPEEISKTPVTSFAVVTSVFSLNDLTYVTSSNKTGESTYQTMDVEPDLVDGRIFAPVRYVAYAAGVEPDNIDWEQDTGTVILSKDDTKIQLRLRSHVMHVNGQSVTMDAVPYTKAGRTMLPPRWVAEALGAKVDWDAEKQQTIITIETEVEVEPE